MCPFQRLRIEPRYDTVGEFMKTVLGVDRTGVSEVLSNLPTVSALFTPYSTNVIVLAFISVSYTALKKEMLVKPDHESAVAHLF